MEEVLAQAKKVAEEAEVFMVSAETTPVKFEANRLKHIESKQSTTVALRVIKDGRVGYAVTTALDSKSLVDMAVETAQFGMPAKFEFPSSAVYPDVPVFDPDIGLASIDEMINLGEGLIANVTSHTPDILCEAQVTRVTVSIRIINSRGGQAGYRAGIFSAGVEGTLVRDTDMLFVGESQSSCRPFWKTKIITDVVLGQLDMARNQAQVSGKTLPVIFTPDGVASALMPSLMAGFNGKMVLEGASPVGNKLGKRVFDERFELTDNPTIEYRPDSRPFDDEGVPSRETALVKQGNVAGFLYDLQTAAMANTSSTGNGSRSRIGLPTPAPSAFIIAPGDVSLADMVGNIKEGLVIEQLLGAGQTNVLGGDFSGNVLLGYKVENGKIVGRVKNTMVSGNIYELLNNIAAIGSEPKWVGGFLCTPPIYFHAVSVAAK